MIAGVESPRFWTQTSLVLELTITAAIGVAGVLTAGVLVQSDAGATPFFNPRNAALAWTACACLAGAAIAIRRRLPPDTVARHKSPLLLLLPLAVAWVLLVSLGPVLRAGDGLAGEYFMNPEWSGAPAFTVVDREMSTARLRRRWGGAPPERFSARWTGFLTVGTPGLYTFFTTSDDGSRLLVNDLVVVDNSGPHSLSTQSGAVHLHRGSHAVVLRYEQFGAASALDWSWSRDGGRHSTVPAWALSQRRTTYPRALAARVVDWALRACSILIVLAAVWYFRTAVSWAEVGHRAAGRRLAVTASFRNTQSLVLSACIVFAILFLPWPDGGLLRSANTTVRALNTTAMRMFRSLEAFRADINAPAPDESLLSKPVQEILTMLRNHDLARYQISAAIAADTWSRQEVVALAWPRKLEPDAEARFVLNGEAIIPGCQLIDRQREVSLVYCP